MASDPLLHIKDSYYFDVPRKFWRVSYDSPTDMADRVGEWVVRNDADYQDWEADLFLEKIREIIGEADGLAHAKEAWAHWQHEDSHRHGRPFDQYVEDSLSDLDAAAAKWVTSQEAPPRDPSQAYLADHPDEQLSWMQTLRVDPAAAKKWANARRDMNDRQVLDRYLDSERGEWSAAKTGEISKHLSGKVFIPQPFAELRNAYEVERGFGVSKYMVIEVLVAIILFLVFRWLAGKIQSGGAPRGKAWNFLESMVSFVKTDVVEKGIEPHDSPKFMPLFWTIFFFILGCNLMGMLPWMGSPTGRISGYGDSGIGRVRSRDLSGDSEVWAGRLPEKPVS